MNPTTLMNTFKTLKHLFGKTKNDSQTRKIKRFICLALNAYKKSPSSIKHGAAALDKFHSPNTVSTTKYKIIRRQLERRYCGEPISKASIVVAVIIKEKEKKVPRQKTGENCYHTKALRLGTVLC